MPRIFKVGNSLAPTLGRIRFSTDGSGAQKMITRQETQAERFSQNTLEKLMHPSGVNPPTVLLSMNTHLLPVEIMQVMQAMGLEEDLQVSCPQVVICSHLLIEIAKLEGQPVYDFCPGFVIERDAESPYYVEENDPALNSLIEKFIVSPGETVFVNHEFMEHNSTVAEHFSLSPLLVYFMGFKESEVQLLFAIAKLKESQQLVVSYPLRAFYAAQYFFYISKKLKSQEARLFLHPYASSQLTEKFNQLDPTQQKLVRLLRY
ncbi:MAG: hypothetical protein WCT39_02930 [Candidatus Margulisiibacteriota bacterium]